MTEKKINSFIDLLDIFSNFLNEQNFIKEPENLYKPYDYIMNLGGKRIRPILCLIGNQLFEQNLEDTLKAAMAVEVFHNFSLVHDDVMDQAPLRRGKPTVHHKYDLNTAILSGDLMLVDAYEYLAKIDSPQLPQLIRLFNQTARQVCEGQQWDMDFESRDDVGIEDYLNMIEHKTAVLLACSLKMGAIIGNASEEEANHLYEFGRNIGISFQLQDDLLDSFGGDGFGKKIGGDIAQNKKTFLLLKAQERVDPDTAVHLQQLLDLPTEQEAQKIEGVIKIYKRFGISQEARNLMYAYYDAALAHLGQIETTEEALEPLVELTKMLMMRSS